MSCQCHQMKFLLITLLCFLTIIKSESNEANIEYIKKVLLRFLSTLKRDKRSGKTQWTKWTPWSQCNVTCGKGRVIRWRHCKANCDGLETEMEQITCQLPECPRKLFGLIKL